MHLQHLPRLKRRFPVARCLSLQNPFFTGLCSANGNPMKHCRISFALRGVNFWTGEVHQWTISFHLMESDMISTSNLLVLVTLLVEFKYCFLKAYVVRNVDKIFCFSSFKSPLEAGLGLMVIDSILIFNS